jgi:hypothetical protein
MAEGLEYVTTPEMTAIKDKLTTLFMNILSQFEGVQSLLYERSDCQTNNLPFTNENNLSKAQSRLKEMTDEQTALEKEYDLLFYEANRNINTKGKILLY